MYLSVMYIEVLLDRPRRRHKLRVPYIELLSLGNCYELRIVRSQT
jgi:hypothetical protein